MNYLYGLLVVLALSLIFVLSYYFNNKVKVECDDKMCEGCGFKDCFYKINKEE